ncbi:hypothetical protein EDD86DRAFT_265643 [Gorgonomyces haynaldii]|nr:hypothetical protein EDD86DRAFT_265643 [Gorgonomyces haynaldii]
MSKDVEKEMAEMLPESRLFQTKKSLDMSFSLDFVMPPKDDTAKPKVSRKPVDGIPESTPQTLPTYTQQKKNNFGSLFRRGSKDKDTTKSLDSLASSQTSSAKGSKLNLQARGPRINDDQDDSDDEFLPEGQKKRAPTMSLADFLATTGPEGPEKPVKTTPKTTVKKSFTRLNDMDDSDDDFLPEGQKKKSESMSMADFLATTGPEILGKPVEKPVEKKPISAPMSAPLTPARSPLRGPYELTPQDFTRKRSESGVQAEVEKQDSSTNVEIEAKDAALEAKPTTSDIGVGEPISSAEAEQQTQIETAEIAVETVLEQQETECQTDLTFEVDDLTQKKDFLFNIQADALSSHVIEAAIADLRRPTLESATQHEATTAEVGTQSDELDEEDSRSLLGSEARFGSEQGDSTINVMLMSENTRLHQEVTALKLQLANEQAKAEQMKILKEAAEARFEQLARVAHRKLVQATARK